MRGLRALTITILLAASGCAAYGGATPLMVRATVVKQRGFEVSAPTVLKAAAGTRFHGSVCRESATRGSLSIRIERVTESGVVLAAAVQQLSPLGGHQSQCTFYNVWTDWAIAPGDIVRVCVQSSTLPCAAARL